MVERSWTRIEPFEGISIPLINLRKVVLPLPLRPRRTRVSPRGIDKEMSESTTPAGIDRKSVV